MRPHLRRVVPALVAIALPLSVVSCSVSSAAPVTEGRRPAAANFTFLARRPVSFAVPDRPGDFVVDLRQHDLSKEDLSGAGKALMGHGLFDTATRWPETLPAGYDPQRIMELGKDPGLGVRLLHQRGITGKGIRVAFLDQTLLVEHEEYKDRVERYREIGNVTSRAAPHASAVLSILAGKSTGVAPDVSVTAYAVDVTAGPTGKITWINAAKAIHQILGENAQLPPAERIRVIGVALGYGPDLAGYSQIRAAVARAKREGVFVLTTTVDQDYNFRFHGLGRDPLADPNDPGSYLPGAWWEEQFWQHPDWPAGWIMAPMDARTTASPTGSSEYVFYRMGGWSWVVPYLEGLYAMGLQVKPDLTPEEFYRVALETGTYTEVTRDGKTARLGPIINPVALIEKLQSR